MALETWRTPRLRPLADGVSADAAIVGPYSDGATEGDTLTSKFS